MLVLLPPTNALEKLSQLLLKNHLQGLSFSLRKVFFLVLSNAWLYGAGLGPQQERTEVEWRECVGAAFKASFPGRLVNIARGKGRGLHRTSATQAPLRSTVAETQVLPGMLVLPGKGWDMALGPGDQPVAWSEREGRVG